VYIQSTSIDEQPFFCVASGSGLLKVVFDPTVSRTSRDDEGIMKILRELIPTGKKNYDRLYFKERRESDLVTHATIKP